jgi:hypothetical protein
MAAEAHQISFVTGGVSDDGSAIRLRVQTERDGLINLSLPTVDLQHLVTLLLQLGGKAAANGSFEASSETFWTRPLPLHGVSLCVDDNKAVMTVEGRESGKQHLEEYLNTKAVWIKIA